MDSGEFESEASVNSEVAHRHDSTLALWIQRWSRQFRCEDGAGRDTSGLVQFGCGLASLTHMHPSPQPLPSKIISMKRLYIASLLGALVLYSGMVELAICSSNFTDQLALLTFKSHITQDPNIKLGNWTTETNFCDWVGVSCSRRRQRVTVLSLGNMGLAGSITPYIGNLSFLKVLDLGNISFQGPLTNEIEELSSLSFLRTLLLGKNNLTGRIPPSFGNISSLESFGLGSNNIHGSIPIELAQLPNLKAFDLSSNHLTGRIPPSFGNISSLESFRLGSNNIHGSIPIELAQLPNLKAFDLSSNHLSGLIVVLEIVAPIVVLQIMTLRKKFVFVGCNGEAISLLDANPTRIEPCREVCDVNAFKIATSLIMTGVELPGLVPSLVYNHSSLRYLSLADNQLTGPIQEFTSSILDVRFEQE
ncbi:hypothetical protein TEA_019364 [Camellia sinensis var. sinensis]|uniref:Leucine-rich repeat-containing N-terminal plant-type domain-containing protein n=1 Tax=Camellia sinensis var. sinensis TaxID=542762 RepID=A0A4S4EGH3_CAMSN|nr:hypothetical protein TEA_019364 [Camellia sinensis var. sinensis]